jgi:hypothetical protein
MDFFDLKGEWKRCWTVCNLRGSIPGNRAPQFSPAMCAEVSVGEEILGVMANSPKDQENYALGRTGAGGGV